MIKNELLKVNEPNVVHETIEGEAILLDLQSGNYFSLDGAGAVIWDFIAQTGDWRKAISLISQNNGEQKELIVAAVEKFIAELIEEKLLVTVDNDAGFPKNGVEEFETALQNAARDFKIPIVNKYSDMQDLLLLDPIHDVDETGWPEAQQPEATEGLPEEQSKD